MRIQDILEMNGHDKQAIYEAYSIEAASRKQINTQLNEERKVSAMHRYDAMAWQDAYLESVVRYAVEIEGDTEEAIEDYFAHPKRYVAMTEAKGFIAFTDEGDHLFIWFMYTNPRAWGKEFRDLNKMIRDLATNGKAIRWVGVNNVLRNHSVEIEPGVYELRL